MADSDFIPEDQVAAPAPQPTAATAATPDFIPEDKVQGSATTDTDRKAGAFASGILSGVPFAKDIASAATPVLKNYVAPALQAVGRPINRALGIDQNAVDQQWKTANDAMPSSYTAARDALDQNTAALKQAHPGYEIAGNIAGGAATMAGAPASGIGAAIKTGMTYGAAQGAGEGRSLSDRAVRAGTGAVAGGLGGLAGGVLGAPFHGANPATAAVADTANQFGVDLPRAVAGTPSQQAAGKVVGMTPVGGAIGEATNKAAGQVGQAVAAQAGTIGGGTKESAVDNAVPVIRDWLDQGFKKEAQGIYAPLTPLNTSKALGDLPNTRAIAQDILNQQAGKNAEAAMPPAVQDVLDAATRPGGLTFGQMNGLKTDLGRSASWDARGDSDGFKRLYGALTDDVRNHAQAIGGNQGLVSFDSANSQFQSLLTRNQAIRKMVGAGSDENVFDKFASKAMDNVGPQGKGGDLATIAHVKQSIPDTSYNELVSGMVGRLGQKNGSTDMQQFMTDWGKMSTAAKDQVFSTPGTAQVRQNIDQIATVANMLKNAKPTSHLAGQLGGVEQGMELLNSIGRREYGRAALIAGTAVGGSQAAKYLASPVGSGAMANVMKSYAAHARMPSAQSLTNLRNTLARTGAILGTRANPFQGQQAQ
jgi:hypothetical protein